MIFNNSTNIDNKTRNHLSLQIIEHKKTKTCGVGSPGPLLGGGIELVNGSPYGKIINSLCLSKCKSKNGKFKRNSPMWLSSINILQPNNPYYFPQYQNNIK